MTINTDDGMYILKDCRHLFCKKVYTNNKRYLGNGVYLSETTMIYTRDKIVLSVEEIQASIKYKYKLIITIGDSYYNGNVINSLCYTGTNDIKLKGRNNNNYLVSDILNGISNKCSLLNTIELIG